MKQIAVIISLFYLICKQQLTSANWREINGLRQSVTRVTAMPPVVCLHVKVVLRRVTSSIREIKRDVENVGRDVKLDGKLIMPIFKIVQNLTLVEMSAGD
jgi:hypothetical protein